jgi:shikimate dehydrogenase
MPRLGVLGWPVAHSRSPAMHEAAFRALGLDGWTYQHLPVPPELLDETVRALGPVGFVGANATIPHKEAALALADQATDAARQIGAANTLTFAPDGAIGAENTDAPGLLAALPESPSGKTALVLGAGGAGRAAAWALRNAGAAEVRVWNRTPERARALATDLDVTVAETAASANFLVNCTSIGLDARPTQFKGLPVTADALGEFACVVDLVYRDGETALIREARKRGCAVVDGLEVLVHQGALSLRLWTGRQAPLAAMRDGARGRPSRRHDPREPPSPSPRARDSRRGSAGT